MNRYVMRVINAWKNPSVKNHFYFILTVVILLAISWTTIYFAGGTTYAYVHLMYIPVIIASFFWGIIGGGITAIASGILVGPFMPLDVEHLINQPLSSWILRTLFFLLISLVVGYISILLKRYIIFANSTFDQLSSIYANTLRNYAKMVSIRDEQTSHHCERVAYNSRLVGIHYGLSEQQSEALYWAGLLHDVGKIGVREQILLKPDKLTSEEYSEIQKHTIFGDELIKSLSEDLLFISQGVRSHHEKWNGEGYPDGLRGEEIPLFGRIITVVDVFEALTAIRPYKESWTSHEAIDYLIHQKGISFDPDIVDIFVELYDEGKIWIYNESFHMNEDVIPSTFRVTYNEKIS